MNPNPIVQCSILISMKGCMLQQEAVHAGARSFWATPLPKVSAAAICSVLMQMKCTLGVVASCQDGLQLNQGRTALIPGVKAMLGGNKE